METAHLLLPLAQHTAQEHTIGPFRLLMLGLVGLIMFRVLFLRRDNRVSLLVPVLAGLMIVSVLLTGYATVGPRRRATTPAPAASKAPPAVLPPAAGPLAETVPAAEQDDVTTTQSTSLRIEETEHGNMLVMPLSSEVLEQYLGPDGTRALEGITSALPEELNQAYFMVPIPGTMGDAVPGLAALASAISQVTKHNSDATPQPPADPTTADSQPVAEASADPIMAVRPKWVDAPHKHEIVVKTEFDESQEEVEQDLHRQVTSRLLEAAWKDTAPSESGAVHDHRQFQLTSAAVDSCIQARYRDEVVLELADGPATMYATTALLDFPPGLRTQAVRHVKESLQYQRTWTVGAAAVSLGLVLMLTAGLLQLAGSTGRFARYIGVPLMALIMLPGLFISGHLVHKVASNDHVDVPSELALQDTLIDFDSSPE